MKDKIDGETRPTLESEVTAVGALREINEDNEQKLAELNAGLDMLPEGGYMDEAEQAREDAMDAQMRAKAAQDRVRKITEGGLDKANELEQIIRDANRAIADGRTDGALSLIVLLRRAVNVF